jgi:hypothetical protein
MIGRRVPDKTPRNKMKPGDYGRRIEHPNTVTDEWNLCLPNGMHGTISNKIHNITEHADGTITVSPSILLEAGDPKHSWHGYLENGIWRSC